MVSLICVKHLFCLTVDKTRQDVYYHNIASTISWHEVSKKKALVGPAKLILSQRFTPNQSSKIARSTRSRTMRNKDHQLAFVGVGEGLGEVVPILKQSTRLTKKQAVILVWRQLPTIGSLGKHFFFFFFRKTILFKNFEILSRHHRWFSCE